MHLGRGLCCGVGWSNFGDLVAVLMGSARELLMLTGVRSAVRSIHTPVSRLNSAS